MSFPCATRTAIAAALMAATLGACSDLYYERRDTVMVVSGEAMAANRVTHMIDPWPPASANRNIIHNGERMQAAAERYRSHTIIQPVSPLTAGSLSQPQPPPALTTEAVPNSTQTTQSAPSPGKP
jgi:hypothetical protein